MSSAVVVKDVSTVFRSLKGFWDRGVSDNRPTKLAERFLTGIASDISRSMLGVNLSR